MCWKKMYLSTIGRVLPTDVFSGRFPVSVKGVCLCEGKVVLVKNEHGQWDLPGGKLREREELVACLERELTEELGVAVAVGGLLDLKVVRVRDMIDVLVPVYLCTVTECAGSLKRSDEHYSIGVFGEDELAGLVLAADYGEVLRVGLRV
jgi:8-oxo-dGTP pyrophosphatase MutT (NUDIX family)